MQTHTYLLDLLDRLSVTLALYGYTSMEFCLVFLHIVLSLPYLPFSLKYNDFSEDVFEIMDQCGKIRY